MLKSLLEYIEQVSEETNPVNTILAVSELIRKDADSEDRPAKIRMFTFINDLKNAGLNISYEGLKAYYDASPQLQNVISQFNDEEVIFLSHSGDDQADITPEPTGDIPPEKKVNQMAKAALAKREGYTPGTKMKGGTDLYKFLGKSDDDDEKYIQKIEPQGKNTLGRVPFARRTVNDDIELSEKCWDGYQKKGMKTMFGKRVPNCVKKEDIEEESQLSESPRDLKPGDSVMTKDRGMLKIKYIYTKEKDRYDALVLFDPQNYKPKVRGGDFQFHTYMLGDPGSDSEYNKQDDSDLLDPKIVAMFRGPTMTSGGAGKAVKQLYAKVYRYVDKYDDAALEYLDDNAPMFTQMFQKYQDIDSLVKALDDDTLEKLAGELESVADELKGGVLESSDELSRIKSLAFGIEVDLDERELSEPEKSKMKKYEKKVPKEEFIKRYGKDKGEMVYYGTLTNMAKDNA